MACTDLRWDTEKLKNGERWVLSQLTSVQITIVYYGTKRSFRYLPMSLLRFRSAKIAGWREKVTRHTFVTDHLQTALCYRTHKFCWQMLAVNQLHADDDGRHFQLLFIYRRWLWSGVLLLLRLLPLPSSAESAGANGRWTSVMSKGETFSGGLIIENGHPGSLNGRMVIDELTHSEVRVQRRSLKKAASV